MVIETEDEQEDERTAQNKKEDQFEGDASIFQHDGRT
jgi:hypothetical protein